MGIGLLRLPVAFATAVAIFFGSLLTALPVSAGSSNMQTLINQDRASNGGLAPLSRSDCLSAAAIPKRQSPGQKGETLPTNSLAPRPGGRTRSTPLFGRRRRRDSC